MVLHNSASIVKESTYRLLGRKVERVEYFDGKITFSFEWWAWLVLFIKNKHYHVLDDIAEIAVDNELTLPDLSLKSRIKGKISAFFNKSLRRHVQPFVRREIFVKRIFMIKRIREKVVTDVPYEQDYINVHIESLAVIFFGYALIFRSKYLFYKALDLQALPATRRNNPNKTEVDFT